MCGAAGDRGGLELFEVPRDGGLVDCFMERQLEPLGELSLLVPPQQTRNQKKGKKEKNIKNSKRMIIMKKSTSFVHTCFNCGFLDA